MEAEVPIEMSLQAADLLRINKILDLLTQYHITQINQFRKRYNLLEALYTNLYGYITKLETRVEMEGQLRDVCNELIKSERGDKGTFFNTKFLALERAMRLFVKREINNPKKGVHY